MTEKPKCPFCGYKLNESYDSDENIVGYFCANPHCRIKADVLEPYVWQALISGKKAQDALKGIEIRVATIRGCVQDGYTQLGERNRNIFIALELFKDLIKEITSITKQEKQ